MGSGSLGTRIFWSPSHSKVNLGNGELFLRKGKGETIKAEQEDRAVEASEDPASSQHCLMMAETNGLSVNISKLIILFDFILNI